MCVIGKAHVVVPRSEVIDTMYASCASVRTNDMEREAEHNRALGSRWSLTLGATSSPRTRTEGA